MRPQDLVGAITGETSLSGRDVGAIDIRERFSLVEVPAAAVRDVVSALSETRIKGRRAPVRPDRDSEGGPPSSGDTRPRSEKPWSGPSKAGASKGGPRRDKPSSDGPRRDSSSGRPASSGRRAFSGRPARVPSGHHPLDPPDRGTGPKGPRDR